MEILEHKTRTEIKLLTPLLTGFYLLSLLIRLINNRLFASTNRFLK